MEKTQESTALDKKFEDIKKKRDIRWLATAGGINRLFLDDLEEHGPVSVMKFEKYSNSLKTLTDETKEVSSKGLAIDEIRSAFRDKLHIDHFLWISGIKTEPKKKSMKIMSGFMGKSI